VALPVVSLLPFLNRNMEEKFAILSRGPNYVRGEGYNTIKQARDDGALVLAYGCVFQYFLYFSIHLPILT
jgi:large conductance mechanosensitive channel